MKSSADLRFFRRMFNLTIGDDERTGDSYTFSTTSVVNEKLTSSVSDGYKLE